MSLAKEAMQTSMQMVMVPVLEKQRKAKQPRKFLRGISEELKKRDEVRALLDSDPVSKRKLSLAYQAVHGGPSR